MLDIVILQCSLYDLKAYMVAAGCHGYHQIEIRIVNRTILTMVAASCWHEDSAGFVFPLRPMK